MTNIHRTTDTPQKKVVRIKYKNNPKRSAPAINQPENMVWKTPFTTVR
jgi:hypothetical protein